MNPQTYSASAPLVADASAGQRVAFIRRTYMHLGGAILAFAAIEGILFQTGIPRAMLEMLGNSRFSWLLVLGAFMGISYLANTWAMNSASVNMQYAGLGLYVVAQAFLFLPMLAVVVAMGGSDTLFLAGAFTLLLFTGLTYTAFTTKTDFNFLGGILKIGGFVALGVIVCSALFGFTLGVLFSAIMIAFAAGSILYETSNVMLRYNTSQHVAASLGLFASVALLFWYILRLLMGLGRRD